MRFGQRVARGFPLWHDARMAREKKKMSKFDRAALEIAEGIANLPVEADEEAARLVKKVKEKKGASKRSKKTGGLRQTR